MRRKLHEQWQDNSWRRHWYLGMADDTVENPEYAPDVCGFFLRLLAWVVDNILLAVLITLFMFTLILAGWVAYPRTDQGVLLFMLGLLISIMMLRSAYYAIFQGNNGQSVGQAVLGIRIVDKNGQVPSIRQVLRRRSARFLSFLPLGLGYIWIIIDSEGQSFHDKIAGTYVVSV